MAAKFTADAPYCPIPQPDCYPSYVEGIYPVAWAIVEDNGVWREATRDEIAELSDLYDAALSRSFSYALPN